MKEPVDLQFTKTERKYYFQIDVMKTLMIVLVILDHILPYLAKDLLYIQFWFRLSVPIFLIIMGFNYGKSFQYRGYSSVGEFYSRDYINQKSQRYLFPFLILFIPLTLIAVILDQYNLRIVSSRAIFPFWGPGIWYIPVVLSAVIILPGLYILFEKKPHLTLSLCFTIELIMHLLLYFLLESTQNDTLLNDVVRFLFQSNILLYFSAIALGIWFSFNHKLFSQGNRFVWIALPFSLLYILFYEFAGWRPFFIMSDYNFMLVAYSAIMFLLFMNLLPDEPRFSQVGFFKRMSRSTYHILLVQAVLFSILYYFNPGILNGEVVFSLEIYIILILLITSISFAVGNIWQENEKKLFN